MFWTLSKISLCLQFQFSRKENMLFAAFEHSHLCQSWACLLLGSFPSIPLYSIYHGYGKWKTSSCSGKGMATGWRVREKGYFASSLCLGQLHISITVSVPTREAHPGPRLSWDDLIPKDLCLSSLGEWLSLLISGFPYNSKNNSQLNTSLV